ncbi:MAG TPA: cytochrome b/b6 domain-containing protein [Anaerolineae bacterium]|nr:cytochrome b/b6 domain-containing protein [Anaerolineae bacterium]
MSDFVSKEEQYPRFRTGARIEHIILLVSFTILTVTGLPQKYAETGIGQGMIDLMGGIETVRLIHRYSAFLLIAGSAYHLFTGAYRFFVKHERMRILPDKKDVVDAKDTVAFNLGFKDEHPKMRKFNFGEKFEYWAVVWGTGVMIITGFMLLNPVATTSILPGEIIPAALAAHGWEAVLAAAAIVIWHFYNVLIKQFNPSMWTGKLPRSQMQEEHAIELERLEAGGSPWQVVDRPILLRRRRIFIVVSLVVGAIFLAGIVWIFTFEETAITTIPRVTQEVFVPLATPGS